MVTLPLLPVVPRHVTVFVNWACNLTCRECWMYGDSSAESHWLKEVKRDEISIEMWNAVVDELATNQQEKVYLTIMGGEPLMHPEIVELVKQAKTRMPDCNLDMSTNATLLPGTPTSSSKPGSMTSMSPSTAPTPRSTTRSGAGSPSSGPSRACAASRRRPARQAVARRSR